MNVRRWWPPIAWAVVVLVLNSIPGSALPATADGLDKVIHVALYAVLGMLGARAAWTSRPRWRAVEPLVVAIALFGALDEAHQLLVPGRTADVRDWTADVVGAGLGAAVVAATLQRQQPA